MGVAERSRDYVEAKLEELEEVYGSFTINQTTITLPGEQYASKRERGNPLPVAAYAAIHNEDGDVLHVKSDDELELPGVHLPLDASFESAVRTEVRETTGVQCTIRGLEQVTIAGLRNGDDPEAETLYNLVVVFTGTHQAGVPVDCAEWHQTTATLNQAYA